MTTERDRKLRYEEFFRIETIVELRQDGHFPKSFIYKDQPVEVLTIQRARTDLRSSSRGVVKVNKTQYEVKTNEGLFELEKDSLKNTWTLVGKLKE